MQKLNIIQKQIIANILYYESEFIQKIDEDAYSGSRAYEILNRWISEVLGLDFRKDIYNDKKVFELNTIPQVKDEMVKTYKQWFIGDAIMDIMYDISRKPNPTSETIEEMEDKMKECWSFFQSLQPKAQDRYIYVDSGVNINGEQLYKRVER